MFESPGFSGRVEGRRACVDSYRQFMSSAQDVEYVEHDVAVQTWGTTAVARTHWEMAWRQGDGAQREDGHDVLLLTRDGGRWQIVWRTRCRPRAEAAARPAQPPDGAPACSSSRMRRKRR